MLKLYDNILTNKMDSIFNRPALARNIVEEAELKSNEKNRQFEPGLDIL